MYNDDLKTRFINERSAEVILANKFLERIFNISESFEEELDKDISCFTTSEILDLYRLINARSLDRLMNIHSQLRYYTQWCLQQNLVKDGINHFDELNIDVINTCVNVFALEESIFTRQQVLDIIRQFKNARDKFSVLMVFETGKSKEFSNIFQVKSDDFSDGFCKLPDGRKVKISSELYRIVMECIEEDEIDTYIANPYRSYHAHRKLIPSEYVYKDVVESNNFDYKSKRSRLQTSSKKLFEYVGLPRTTKINAFVESGIIWDIKEAAIKYNVTNEELLYIKEVRDVIEYQHNTRISPKTFFRKYGRYLE